MKRYNLSVKRIIFGLIGSYLLYVLLTAVVLFGFYSPDIQATVFEQESAYEYFRSKDRVALVDDGVKAGMARLHVIENATSSLDISYYSMQGGDSVPVFFSTIIDAADRGVEVQILLDGFFHNLRGKDRDMIYAVEKHPNIELRFYETLDILRPWTWHNRLHDKFIIADQEVALIGGRNIGDKYFASEEYQDAVFDRDVMIKRTSEIETNSISAIDEMSNYFQLVWEHEYTTPATNNLRNRQMKKAENSLGKLRETYVLWQENKPLAYQETIDWEKMFHPTNGVYFVHNSLERGHKEPNVWLELVRLMELAEDSIFLQSPYIIPTDNMTRFLNVENVTADDITLLTNSLAATPNIVAHSGYRNHRKDLAGRDLNLYEYQGPNDSVHTKSMVFDKQISAVGSFNLDARSTFLNTESMVFIDSESFAHELIEKQEQTILPNSLPVSPTGDYHPEYEEMAAPVSSFKRGLAFITSILVGFFEFLL